MIRLADIAARFGLAYRGDAGRLLSSMAALSVAGPDQLSIYTDQRYLGELRKTRAGAVLLCPDDQSHCPVDCLLADDPYLQFARLSQLFAPETRQVSGRHPTACIADDAVVHPSASVGPGVTIGPRSIIMEGVSLGPGSSVGADSRIGSRTVIGPAVTVYHDVLIGDDCEVQAGAVIGSDGFGFARGDRGWEKIYHHGGVRIGDRVHIGAGTTVDRGSLEHTCIEDGVIIDNQVQIAHNCRIGKNTAIAGCAALAGGSIIGADCTLAGGVGVVGHARLCDGVHVTAMSLVTRSVSEPGSYSSGTAFMPTSQWKRSAARFRRLHRGQGDRGVGGGNPEGS